MHSVYKHTRSCQLFVTYLATRRAEVYNKAHVCRPTKEPKALGAALLLPYLRFFLYRSRTEVHGTQPSNYALQKPVHSQLQFSRRRRNSEHLASCREATAAQRQAATPKVAFSSGDQSLLTGEGTR